AVDEPVAVVVATVAALLGHRRAHAGAGELRSASGVGTVDQIVAVVVLPVAADLRVPGAAARSRARAVGVVAVEEPVAVLVETVPAKGVFARRTAALGRPLALDVQAIDARIAVVVDAVATVLARG